MRKRTFTLLLTALLLTAFISGRSQTCSITGNNEINVNQTLTYSTSATSGAGYFWSVTGGLTITGSNTGSSVSVKGVTTGTGQVCVTKYKAGTAPCCECKPLVINPGPPVCPPEPFIYEGTCGGYPSVHPHWRFGLIEDPFAGTGTYSWSGTNFTFDSSTSIGYVVGRPTSAGYFTIYCTVTYNCTPSGTITYNLSLTLHTNDCPFPPKQMASVYPNPVSTSTTVKYQLAEEGNVTVLLKNDAGEKVAVLANQQQKAGDHEMFIAGETFPKKGIYILDLYFNNKILSQHRIIKE